MSGGSGLVWGWGSRRWEGTIREMEGGFKELDGAPGS